MILTGHTTLYVLLALTAAGFFCLGRWTGQRKCVKAYLKGHVAGFASARELYAGQAAQRLSASERGFKPQLDPVADIRYEGNSW